MERCRDYRMEEEANLRRQVAELLSNVNTIPKGLEIVMGRQVDADEFGSPKSDIGEILFRFVTGGITCEDVIYELLILRAHEEEERIKIGSNIQ